MRVDCLFMKTPQQNAQLFRVALSISDFPAPNKSLSPPSQLECNAHLVPRLMVNPILDCMLLEDIKSSWKSSQRSLNVIRRSEKLDSEWMMNWKLQLLNSDIWKINKFVIKIRNTTFWLVRNLKGQLHAEALIDLASFWSLQPTCAVHCDATEWTHITYTEESPDWNCWWVNELKSMKKNRKMVWNLRKFVWCTDTNKSFSGFHEPFCSTSHAN